MTSELTWPANRVRDAFVSFFTERGHTNVVSSPVVPHNDPTLLFANAGMNQFKPIFLGQADPTSHLYGMKRAANSQKCIRAGGKHNDLDDVGRDVYHHTFFEMLGNWSFGDYFKRESIYWAFELLTSVYGIDKERLYVTYFGGGEGIEADIEARDIWRELLPAERVLPFDKKANFWEMGDTGPCGPCSEIHFDRIGGRDAASLVNMDDPNVLEVWNIVFIQFNRKADGSLELLPAKHVDTGMGFERITSVLQGKMSNYDTDVFQPLFTAIQAITGAAPYEGKVGAADTHHVDMAYRVLADHARTLTFAITDGAMPSNLGRGYVLRRILRRAVRYGQQVLKAPAGKPFFYRLVDVVVDTMGDVFPTLKTKASFVKEVIEDEEQAFNRTLLGGLKYFDKVKARLATEGVTVVPGKDAFFLYDSMGFPLDLTQRMAEESGLTVDVTSYNACMDEAKVRSQLANSAHGASRDLVLEAAQTAHLGETLSIATTDDSAKYTWHHKPTARVQAIYTPEGFLKEGEAATSSLPVVGIVLDVTSFYSESGGQIYDTGVLRVVSGGAGGAGAGGAAGADEEETVSSGPQVAVVNVQTFGGYVLHIGSVQSGTLTVGDTVSVEVDYERRADIAPNHTMTHALNYALRKVLGHSVERPVEQRGSLVGPDKLRFDFSFGKALTAEQLTEVDRIVGSIITSAVPVHHAVVPLAQARAIHSLCAVFGETYPDPVRVISIGVPVDKLVADPTNAEWSNFSVELCGGTHIPHSSAAGAFTVVEEGAIAKGVRRIVAVTRQAAIDAFGAAEALRDELGTARALPAHGLGPIVAALNDKVNAATIPAAAKLELREQIKDLQAKSLEAWKAAQRERSAAATAAVLAEAAAAEAAAVAAGGAPVLLVKVVDLADDVKMATKVASNVVADCPHVGILLVSVHEDKVFAVATLPESALAKGFKANLWLNEAIGAVGGRGGGRENNAQGQGVGAARVAEVVEAAKAYAARS